MSSGKSIHEVEIQGKKRWLGWVRPRWPVRTGAFRTLEFTPKQIALAPPAVDNFPDSVAPTVEDQGPVGECGPNSLSDLIRYNQFRQGMPVVMMSRNFTYYITRQLMGTLGQDSGVSNADMIQAVAQYGVCDEKLWPYDTSPRGYNAKPPQSVYDAAAKILLTNHASIPVDPGQMMAALASGVNFVVGFTVYEGFEQIGNDGVYKMPGPRESILGGHDNHCCGYDQNFQGTGQLYFRTRNPWGPGFGRNGSIWFPARFLGSSQYGDDYQAENAIPGPPPVPPPTPTPPPPSPAPVSTYDLQLLADIKAGKYKLTVTP